MESIAQPYLLVTATCPTHVSPQGERWLHELWAKDLALHPEYLVDLTVLSPRVDGPIPEDAVAVTADARLARIRYLDLPSPPAGFWRALADLPLVAVRLWRAIGQARVVHADVVGWPIPIGWVAIVLARLRRRFLVVIVESAPWRITPGVRAGFKKRVRAGLTELVNRVLVRWADLCIFTQEDYRHGLLPKDRAHRGHVINASWIDEADLLPASELQADWERRRAPGQPLRCLFAGRLTEAKGVGCLIEAARLLALDSRASAIEIDIAGDGPMRPDCEAAIAAWRGTPRPRLIGTTRYGPDFFALLRRHDLVLVPSLSDEQPRIVYDAYAQGVPVLASDTPGLRSCVRPGLTGWLEPPGAAARLADRLLWALDHRDELHQLGVAAQDMARGLTHRTMHRRRWLLLSEALADKPQGPPVCHA
jgi:glycosyltransferase involved in cell wall biosynthesis